ncbi:MAG: hypothetical protein U9N49_00185 [Campylobacterota bacterium]|nr:hypothetical protein [Campylobacterota bacterium]
MILNRFTFTMMLFFSITFSGGGGGGSSDTSTSTEQNGDSLANDDNQEDNTPKPSTNNEEETTNSTSNTISKPTVVDCSSLTIKLGNEAVNILNKHNYKKCALVAGILIANSNETLVDGKDITAMTQSLANILAELLDNDQNGVIDNPTVVSYLKTGANGAWMNMQSATNESNEETIVQELAPYLGKDMGVKHSWLIDEYPLSQSKGIKEKHMLVEEALHLIHSYGFARAYPTQWGVSNDGCEDSEASSKGCNWNQSTLTKLAWEATTKDPTWSRHGENSLVNSEGIITGTCAAPECLAVEMIMNTLVVYRGTRESDDSGSAQNFPINTDAITAKLENTTYGEEMKAIFDAPTSSYGQYRTMTWSYNPQ